jgi:protein-S-isoprenylcysteine O-methyltransferase Ste14
MSSESTRPPASTSGVVAPPPVIYAVPFAAGLLMQHWWHLPIVFGWAAAPLGVACVCLGLVGFPAVLAFHRARTSPNPFRPSSALVTTGPFRFSRNPMYVGVTLLYVGVAIWVNTVWPLLFLPVILIVMHYGVVVREEAYLERIFGDEYRQYARRVRRWL